jgi:hypothetical protein|nr:MAG TPA: hypothetical protein [Caudoviricetes sp.]
MTYEEIIQALRRCQFGALCARCPAVSYKNCVDEMHKCAADLIERLTAENTALREGASLGKAKRPQKKAYEKSIEFLRALTDGQSDEIKSLRRELEWKDMVIALAQRKQAEAEADRDAAIADLKISSGCASCKYHCSDPIFCRDCNKKQNCKCMSCSLGLTNWKWHGLPEAPEEGDKADA